MRKPLPFKVMVATAGVLLTACSSSNTSTSSGASTSAPTTTTLTATVATSTTTTVAATTTPSTTLPAPVVLTLRGDGIGPFDLGAAASEAIEAISAQFGPPTSDESLEFPADDGFGGFQDVNGEFSFVSHFGRTVCWAFELCLMFGGDDPTTQFFTGWTYGEASGATLASTSGVTIGTRWSDVPAISVSPGGCYTVGYGSIDGIQLTLLSDGVEFSGFDGAGNYVENIPPADQVSVTFMIAGDIPIFRFGDC